MKKILALSLFIFMLSPGTTATAGETTGIKTFGIGKYKRYKLIGVDPAAGATVVTIVRPTDSIPESVTLTVFAKKAVIRIGHDKYVVSTKNFEKGDHPIIVNNAKGMQIARLSIIK